MTGAERFLKMLARGLTTDERLILCGFKGDPDNAPTHAWQPRPWKRGADVPFNAKHNAYVAVSSFGRAHDGGFRRRQDTFKAGLALMVDDVGTKVHGSKLKNLEPTACIETSPKNYQCWYVLAAPERNQARFDAVIRAFIRGQLLGADPGMAGVTRVGRLPGFTNGKPKHNGWVTRLTHLNAKRLFTIEELCATFDLTLHAPPPLRLVPNETAERRVRMYVNAEKFLKRHKMLKRNTADPSGWREMHCPWVGEHTNGADTGAAIREPRAENQFYGAFRCHHGHCLNKGWKDLTDWIAEHAAEEVNGVKR